MRPSTVLRGLTTKGQVARIRTIDISSLRDASSPPAMQQATANELSSAFGADGFAVITGHGVPAATVEALRSAARGFFDGPPEAKDPFDHGKGYGYGGYVRQGFENGAQLLGDFSRPPDLVESLTLRGLLQSAPRAGVSGAESPSAKPCLGYGGAHRGGPEVEVLPDAVVGAAQQFALESRGLSCALAEVARRGLGVSLEEIDALVDVNAAGCRLAHYPAQRGGGARAGQLRYGAHVDSGGITVLSLDPTNHAGLQVDHAHVHTCAHARAHMDTCNKDKDAWNA